MLVLPDDRFVPRPEAGVAGHFISYISDTSLTDDPALVNNRAGVAGLRA